MEDDLTFDCVLCDGVDQLSAQEMVEHFESVHPVEAMRALQSVADREHQRAVAWLN